MSFSIEEVKSHHSILDGKIGVRMNNENLVSIPVFSFYHSNDNTLNALKFRVDGTYPVADVKNATKVIVTTDTLEEAYSVILDMESMCNDDNLGSVICLSENSLSSKEFFEQ